MLTSSFSKCYIVPSIETLNLSNYHSGKHIFVKIKKIKKYTQTLKHMVKTFEF
jgi:hypothetical protein